MERLWRHETKNGNLTHNTTISLDITIFNKKASLSEAWVAGNLLLFTVFDGYLENTYNLIEGASFKNHYDNLPENSLLERIHKNCYRIIKIIRNGIQHNLSCVTYNDGNYDINYHNRNTSYELQISANGVRNLYTLIMNIIQDGIIGIYGSYNTIGHREGIIYTQNINMIKGITKLSDDIGSDLLNVSGGIKLRAVVRYPVENPSIVIEDEMSITFMHIENNGTDDENSSEYHYSTDYIFNEFLLPQEIGVITIGEGDSFQERRKYTTICFEKKNLEVRWKMKT